MRALCYFGPGDLRLADVAAAPLHSGDVRLAVEAAGVCGTDVRIAKGEHGAYANGVGRVPGHEIVGRVVEAGPSAAAAVGNDHLFVAPNIGCGECPQCLAGNENLCPHTDGLGITLDGAFAETVVVPARAVSRGNLVALPPGVDADAAVLIEPLACVLRGQGKVDVHTGDTVLVCGGGPVGLLHVALARARGAALVVCSEPSPVRRAAAAGAGAGLVVDPAHDDLASVLRDATDGRGADVAITAAPVPALQAQALELAASGGRVLFFAGLPKSRPTVELDTNLIHYKELLIAGTTASTLADCRDAAALVALGRIDLAPLVSHRFGLDQGAAALAAAQDPAALKVVMKPSIVGKAVL
ncbi:MAG: alcohol dehydrogenase catalytic domain-containing protein [Micrococcales bacterium]|nr:alcohol dehydrogenase catalytic domain-containing protein [Micrococcales bacterium]